MRTATTRGSILNDVGKMISDSSLKPIEPPAAPPILAHGSFLARSRIGRYLRRHPVGSMRGYADRRAARQAGEPLAESSGHEPWKMFAAGRVLAPRRSGILPALLGRRP